MRYRCLLVLVGLCLGLAVASPGWAFERAKNQAGKELYWPRGASVAVVKFHIHQDGLGDYFQRNPALGAPQSEFAAIQAAFFAWSSVTCSDARPVGLSILYQGRLAPDKATVGYDDKCATCNTNLVVFIRDRNQWRHNELVLAQTSVTSNPTTGAILDADVEINATGKFVLTTQVESQDNIAWDIQNIITHEAGKFLGLAESTDPKSTMAAKSSQGDLSLRTLEDDDINGICTIYPPDPNAAKIPKYQETEVNRALGCSSTGQSLPPLGLGLLLLGLGLLLLGLGRRQRGGLQRS